MPSAEDGEWSNWCSNVVCVRTKSSKEPEDSSGGPVIQVQPIVVRSTYREEPLPPRTVHQRRRITRLIQSPPLSSPIQYEGVGRVSLSLKATPSVYSSTYNGPSSVEYSRPPLFPPRRRSPVRVVLRRPVEHQYRLQDHLIPDTSSSSSSPLYVSGRDHLQTFTLPSPYIRASSLPPFLSTAHVRRSSVAVPGYSATGTSGYAGRPIVGDRRGVASSLRRGSVDVSYLSSGPDISKSSSYSRHTVPPVRSEVELRSNYRRGSLAIPKSTFRSRSVGRFPEDELMSLHSPLSSTSSETFSSLRTRTEKAKDKLDTHRSLLDRYLPGGSREPSIDNRFDLKDTSVSRRSSVSAALSRPLAGSRPPSMERSYELNSASAASHRTPPHPPSTLNNNMSPARRRIRNVLYKVSGDEEFLS